MKSSFNIDIEEDQIKDKIFTYYCDLCDQEVMLSNKEEHEK